MKRLSAIIVTVAAILAAGLTLNAFLKPMDENRNFPEKGHFFVREWSNYYNAVSADRPKKQIEALEVIKKLSRDQRVAWDFWDASRRYFDASVSVDWKSRDSMAALMGREVKDFDEPVMNIIYRSSYLGSDNYELLKYIISDAERLRKSKNEQFYKYEGYINDYMSGRLPEYIRNDFEYVLWMNLPSYGNEDGLASDRSYRLLDSLLDGRYPDGAYLRYRSIAANTDTAACKSALKAFVKEYKGKAVSYFAENDLLMMKKDYLDKKNAGSEEYKKLYNECKAFESRRHSLSGKEKALAEKIDGVKSLIKSLGSESISVNVFDGKARVQVRNISDFTLEMFPEESKAAVFKKNFKNEKRSFYVLDTVEVALPDIDDGTYKVSAYKGLNSTYDIYSKYRISLAQRRDSKGYGIYATDYLTGEPLKSVDVRLIKNGRTVASTVNFALNDGFTAIPDALSKAIKGGNSNYSVEVSYKGEDGFIRESRRVSFWYSRDRHKNSKSDYGKIFLDRKAFNPGDTVYFKSVLYVGDMVNSVRVFDAGRSVTATLYDTENNKLQDLSLSTNEFGAVAGKFALPSGLKNGIFYIKVKSGLLEAFEPFRVDEFVLPTFDLTFDDIKQLYLPGDTVRVGGAVKSYSGHSLSSAKAVYTAEYAGKVLAEGSIEIAPDGRFEVVVPSSSDDWQYININVKITDTTGETLEYNKGVYVGKVVRLSSVLLNKADAEIVLDVPEKGLGKARRLWHGDRNAYLVLGDVAEIKISVKNGQDNEVLSDVSYILYDENDKEIERGSSASGEIRKFDMSALADGLYVLRTEVSAKSSDGKITAKNSGLLNFVKMTGTPEAIDAPVEHIFWRGEENVESGDEIKAYIGTANGKKMWAVVEVFGDNRELIDSRLVKLTGERGKSGSIASVSLPYKSDYPDAVIFSILYFRDRNVNIWTKYFRRIRHTLDLPLSFSVFEDKTMPGKEYTFKIKTDANVECVATVYDKSLDNIFRNGWNRVSLNSFVLPNIDIYAEPGMNGQNYGDWFLMNQALALEEVVVTGYGRRRPMMVRGVAKAEAEADMKDAVMYDVEAAGPPQESEIDAVEDKALSEVGIRDNFANTLAFRPFLHSDENGAIELKFKTSDKLSTYYVQLFAHDKNMRNAVLAKETVVSVPVKVAVVEPKYLYAGDEYRLAATVASISDRPLSGTLALYQYDGEDYKALTPVKSSSMDITVPAGGSVSRTFNVVVPSDKNRKSGTPIGLKVVFATKEGGFSDGVFVPVPVYKNAQVITEAHSAVLLAGMDKEALIDKIRSAFVNVSSYGAEYQEIAIIDMVRQALPSKVDPANDDCLSLSEAYYVRLVAEKLGIKIESGDKDFITNDKLIARILACQNADGGFSWFEGMTSSPIITSVLLERFAKLRNAGLADISGQDWEKAVKFLDKTRFDFEWPLWCGGVSLDQYLYVRSLYPSVKFEVGYSGRAADFARRMADFKKYVRNYLVPSKDRGLNGYIHGKARRLLTLTNLVESSDGIALAKAWGVNFGVEGKMKKSLQADVVSLLEYAVDHSDGGIYYPNAVMPFRGLLESEAYAHSMLCDLFTAYSTKEYAVSSSSAEAVRVADGIRIWLMLQKETQKWDDNEPAFVDAVNSVLSGSEEVKATKVILMKKSFEKPFEEIKAAGNGMTVERKFYLLSSVEHEAASMHDEDGKTIKPVEIAPGSILKKGDKIRIEYRIWNKENRSFVRLSAPREAALRPVQQLSGMYGWGIRPFRINNWFSFMPHGYRNVKAEKTEYYFDSYPEENTTVSEDFFVTQSGAFVAPVVEIESLYAPHYRANGGFSGKLAVE